MLKSAKEGFKRGNYRSALEIIHLIMQLIEVTKLDDLQQDVQDYTKKLNKKVSAKMKKILEPLENKII